MFASYQQWNGTAETLTQELSSIIRQFNLGVELPTVRTIRLWRSKAIFSQPKKERFGFRQILEGLATTLLLKKGWTLVSIAQVLPKMSDLVLEEQISAELEGKDSSWLPTSLVADHRQLLERAENAVVLLAQGIMRLYNQISLSQKIVRQDDQIPGELYHALVKLGRLYIETGDYDQVACVHPVLAEAKKPLKKWNLILFQDNKFKYKEVVLINNEFSVPTSECGEIATQFGGFGEDNLIQKRLYDNLIQATERLGNRQNFAYSKIREIIGRYSLLREKTLYQLLEENNFTPLQKTVSEFFTRVPDIWLIKGTAHSCQQCHTLMRPHGKESQCPLCHGNQVGEKLQGDLGDLLVAKPPILTYWTGPAIDELRIYDTAKQQKLDVELYPELDRCDVAIGDKIGIDAKSYRDPVSLAMKLNRSIGGLIHYDTRIIAISDQHIENNPYYLTILREILEQQFPQNTLQLLSVSDVIQRIKRGDYEN